MEVVIDQLVPAMVVAVVHWMTVPVGTVVDRKKMKGIAVAADIGCTKDSEKHVEDKSFVVASLDVRVLAAAFG